MLELLAGPFPITNPMNGETVSLADRNLMAMLSPFGLLCWNGTTPSQGLYTNDTFGLIQIDGTYTTRGAPAGTATMTALAADPARQRLLLCAYGAGIYAVDPKTGVYSLPAAVPGDWNTPYSMVRYGDLLLRALSNRIESSPLDATPAFSTLATLSGGNTNTATLSLDSRATLYVGRINGEVQIYDLAHGQQLASKWIDTALGTATGIWYFEKHDVFLSLHPVSGIYYLRVWANAPRPASLSAPAPLGAVEKGRMATFRTRLLGSNEEPCPAETIGWSLVGAGSLLDAQSTTDDDGYATARYVAPLDALPDIEITAEVRF